MSTVKKLVGQTAIYGIPSIIGRVINFALTPIYLLALDEVADFGEMGVMYAIAAFIAVVLTHGMETGFFNFTRKEEDPKEVFNTGFSSILLVSIVFVLLCFLFSTSIINGIGYPGKENYIKIFAVILGLDALMALPYAKLRYENKAVKFAGIRLFTILVNVLVTLYFFVLCPYLIKQGSQSALVSFFATKDLVLYAFIANLISSTAGFLLLLPQMKFRFGFENKPLRKKMLLYSYPLIFTGMAGIVNETFDRVLLKKMLPSEVADHQIGIYNAFYKLSMFMTLFVQAFRYAAEPFFFQESKKENAQESYAKVMEYFVYACLFIFVALVLVLPYIAPIFVTNPAYFEDPNGMKIVPILLLANLFLGVYYNLAVWYKLTHKNMYGAFVAIGGAAVTLILNILFIPKYGIVASAWATLIVYFSMTVVSYLLGRKHYPVPYPVLKIAGAFVLAIALFLLIN